MDSSVDYLIIGGGIAGVTAAEAIRERDKISSISIIASEPHLLYSRVLLPSYVKQRIKREQVFMRTVSNFDTANIHFYAGEEVTDVRPEAHDVVLRSGATVRYRKLLIASGAHVRPVPFEGVDGLAGIFRLQTLDDADAIYEALPSIKEAVVVGGGFIALEFLEILHLRSIKTTLICRGNHFAQAQLSPEGSGVLEANFSERGINTIFGESVVSVTGENGRVVGVVTSSGKAIKCDAVFAGIGIARNFQFLSESGIVLGNDGVLADQNLQTNDPDMYVVGDVAEFRDEVLGISHQLGNWNNAFLQGKTAGKNITGEKNPFRNLSSYAISNLGFHLTFMGRVDRALHSIVRHAPNTNQYAEFFLAGNVLVGASLINLPRIQPLLQRWIIEKRDFAGKEAGLADMQKSLDTLD